MRKKNIGIQKKNGFGKRVRKRIYTKLPLKEDISEFVNKKIKQMEIERKENESIWNWFWDVMYEFNETELRKRNIKI